MKIELSHDILARKIYEKASAEDKMILKIENLVHDNYMRYEERKVLMSREDYDYIAPFLSAINISREENQFLNKSIAVIRRKQRMLNLFILSAIVILTALGGVASFQSYQSKQRADLIEKSNKVLKSQSAELQSQYAEIEAKNREIKAKEIDLKDALDEAVQSNIVARAAAVRAAKAAKEAEEHAEDAESQKKVADSLRIKAEEQTLFAFLETARADSLKNEALEKTRIATLQTIRADSLLGIALLEKARGDTLRALSEAKVSANRAIRMIQEGKLDDGAKLSLEAHQLNDSLGGPYQNADCYAALNLAYQTYLNKKRNKQAERDRSQLSKPHQAAIRCIDTDYSKKRKTIIAYATEDEQVFVVDTLGHHKLKIRVPLARDEIKPRSIALSHDGNLLLVGTFSGHLIAYEYLNGKYSKLQMPLTQYKGPISYIQIVEPIKGAYYVAFADQQHVHLGYISLRSSRNQFSKELSINIQNKIELKDIKTAAFSHDGKYLLVANNSIIQVFELAYNFPKLDFSTQIYQNLSTSTAKNRINISSSAVGKDLNDRYLIALGLKNGSIKIAALDNLDCLLNSDNCEFETEAEHKSEITKLIFNNNGDQLISSSLDKTAKIWNLANISDDRIPLVGHREWIWDLAYSESQDEIYTVSEDRSIKTWVSRSELLAKRIEVERFRARRENRAAPKGFRD